jgi:integrase/recombinase XerC
MRMPGDKHDDIQSFLNYLKFEKRFSAHTILSYETDLLAFYSFLRSQYGIEQLSDITYTFIRSWLAGLKENKMASKTINRKISTLRSYFKYHLKRGAITVLPTANIIAPKVSKRLPVFVNEKDTAVLLDGLRTGTEDWKSLNASLIIGLFYATGMRLNELISLKEKQVDFARKQVRVLGKGNKERIIPVSPEHLKEIRSYIELKRKTFGQEEEVLLLTEKGKKLYPKYAWILVNKYLGDASTLDKKSPHVLRHTFATHLMNNGAELNAVKELLGHANLAATQVYTHNTIEKLKDVYKKAHPRS